MKIKLGLKTVVKLYNRHSVATSGPKGSGKDLITGNVIARRKAKYYISNTDYHIKRKKFIKLNINKLLTENRYDNFIRGNITPYVYPYPDDIDIYIGDCGVYFPSQYNGELNKKYQDFPTFMALSRQLGNCFVHTNCQNPKRVWDKIREQCDRYLVCQRAFVIGKLCIVFARVYEREEASADNIPPYRAPFTLSKSKNDIYLAEQLRYTNQHGKIDSYCFIFLNKTNYNTRLFKEMLENGK